MVPAAHPLPKSPKVPPGEGHFSRVASIFPSRKDRSDSASRVLGAIPSERFFCDLAGLEVNFLVHLLKFCQ